MLETLDVGTQDLNLYERSAGAEAVARRRLAVEDERDAGVIREALDVLQMSATGDHNREAAMPLLTPSGTQYSATHIETEKRTPFRFGELAQLCHHLQRMIYDL